MNRSNKNCTLISFVALVAGVLAACTSEAGTGTVTVAISGEEAAVVGFPVGEGADQIAFADGFTLQFSKVLVSVGDFRLEGADGDSAMVSVDPVIVDLHRGDQALWTLEDVPARRWDRVSYRYVAPTASARNVNADQVDVDRMVAAGASLLVEGTATDGTDTFAFSFVLPLLLDNHSCTNGIDETDGIVVGENTTTEAQITVHLDHLFFDSYATEEPSLRFEAMAAMADAENAITLDALAGQPLASLVDRDGMPLVDAMGAPIVYDPGPLTLGATNLAAYVRAAATTTGHFNGEGHCEYREE